MGKKLHYLEEENGKMGKKYDYFGHFPQIEGNFFWISSFFLPHFSTKLFIPPPRRIWPDY